MLSHDVEAPSWKYCQNVGLITVQINGQEKCVSVRQSKGKPAKSKNKGKASKGKFILGNCDDQAKWGMEKNTEGWGFEFVKDGGTTLEVDGMKSFMFAEPGREPIIDRPPPKEPGSQCFEGKVVAVDTSGQPVASALKYLSIKGDKYLMLSHDVEAPSWKYCQNVGLITVQINGQEKCVSVRQSKGKPAKSKNKGKASKGKFILGNCDDQAKWGMEKNTEGWGFEFVKYGGTTLEVDGIKSFTFAEPTSGREPIIDHPSLPKPGWDCFKGKLVAVYTSGGPGVTVMRYLSIAKERRIEGETNLMLSSKEAPSWEYCQNVGFIKGEEGCVRESEGKFTHGKCDDQAKWGMEKNTEGRVFEFVKDGGPTLEVGGVTSFRFEKPTTASGSIIDEPSEGGVRPN